MYVYATTDILEYQFVIIFRLHLGCKLEDVLIFVGITKKIMIIGILFLIYIYLYAYL